MSGFAAKGDTDIWERIGTARAGVIPGTVGELLRQSQSTQPQTVRWREAKSSPAEEGRESGCETTLSNSPPLHRRVPWALLGVNRRPGRELNWLTSVYRNRCFWQLQRALKTHDLKPRKSHPGLVPKTTDFGPPPFVSQSEVNACLSRRRSRVPVPSLPPIHAAECSRALLFGGIAPAAVRRFLK